MTCAAVMCSCRCHCRVAVLPRHRPLTAVCCSLPPTRHTVPRCRVLHTTWCRGVVCYRREEQQAQQPPGRRGVRRRRRAAHGSRRHAAPTHCRGAATPRRGPGCRTGSPGQPVPRPGHHRLRRVRKGGHGRAAQAQVQGPRPQREGCGGAGRRRRLRLCQRCERSGLCWAPAARPAAQPRGDVHGVHHDAAARGAGRRRRRQQPRHGCRPDSTGHRRCVLCVGWLVCFVCCVRATSRVRCARTPRWGQCPHSLAGLALGGGHCTALAATLHGTARHRYTHLHMQATCARWRG